MTTLCDIPQRHGSGPPCRQTFIGSVSTSAQDKPIARPADRASEKVSPIAHVKCTECGGAGSVPCLDCVCNHCNAKGQVQCRFCRGGTISCSACKGGIVPCGSCGGTGTFTRKWVALTFHARCPHCHGLGKINCRLCSGFGWFYCPTCKGIGRLTCHECRGIGRAHACSRCGGSQQVLCRGCDGAGKVENLWFKSLVTLSREELRSEHEKRQREILHLRARITLLESEATKWTGWTEPDTAHGSEDLYPANCREWDALQHREVELSAELKAIEAKLQ